MALLARWRARPPAPPPAPRPELVALAESVKGFLDVQEGLSLYALAAEASSRGPCVEIGSYCGKSALFLGEGCRVTGQHPLFTVDHHTGSEEQQPGEQYHDPDLYDAERGRFTTLETLAHNVARAGLADWVIPVVGASKVVGQHTGLRKLGLVFIDGSHSEESVNLDYEIWAPRLARDGFLCFHDVFADPNDGGQAPFLAFERARASGQFRVHGQTLSLAVLRKRK